MIGADTSKARGLFAYVVSDPELLFHDLVFAYGVQLGAAGGKVLTWRPVGDPNQVDPVHQEQRTEEQAILDRAESIAFRSNVVQFGDSRWYLNREYKKCAEMFGAPHNRTPFVVFGAPQLEGRVALPIHLAALDSTQLKRELVSLLVSRLSESSLLPFLEDGFFSERSMRMVREHVDKLALDIYRLENRKARALPGPLRMRLPGQGVDTPIQPGIDTILNWHVTDDGLLHLKARSRGRHAAGHVFRLIAGRATKQQNLMHMLLEAWPHPRPLEYFMDGIYAGESESRRGGSKSDDRLSRVRTLFTDTAGTLAKHDFPRGIVPPISRDRDRKFPVVMNAADVILDVIARKGIHLEFCEDPENRPKKAKRCPADV